MNDLQYPKQIKERILKEQRKNPLGVRDFVLDYHLQWVDQIQMAEDDGKPKVHLQSKVICQCGVLLDAIAADIEGRMGEISWN